MILLLELATQFGTVLSICYSMSSFSTVPVKCTHTKLCVRIVSHLCGHGTNFPYSIFNYFVITFPTSFNLTMVTYTRFLLHTFTIQPYLQVHCPFRVFIYIFEFFFHSLTFINAIGPLESSPVCKVVSLWTHQVVLLQISLDWCLNWKRIQNVFKTTPFLS